MTDTDTTNSPDSAFRSITGALESAEPASSSIIFNNTNNAAHRSASPASTSARDPPSTAASSSSTKAATAPTASDNVSSTPMRHHTLNGSRSLNVSGSPSTANSPLSSRDTSPARPAMRTAGTSGPTPRPGLRSRKSSTDVSPNRGPSLAGASTTVPSAAAIQRALSNANIPQLTPASSQDPLKAPRPIKPSAAANPVNETPHWPISPRLKSPPPSTDGRSRSRRNSLRTQPKKSEPVATPSIVVQSSSPASSSRIPIPKDDVVNSDQEDSILTMKGPTRGASGAASKLETVQESSLPATPDFDGPEIQSLPHTATSSKPTTDEERNDVTSSKVTEDLSASKSSKNTESGSDTASRNDRRAKMQEQRSSSTSRPSAISSKSSYTSLTTIKPRTTEAPSRNMTVETEIVPSIAQATIANQDRAASGRGEGSLRLKPSNETIRPKKEKKPAKRKAPSIHSGTASSKADVFEQKVASAVDEFDSSDSDATFIYESNPPEIPDQQPHRSRHHHHSRTPSMTSLASQADPRIAIRDAHKFPGKKISMKFATNPYNNPNADPDMMDRGDGTIRGGSGRVSGSSHHHHIGRHGQGRGALNQLILDSDSSMAQSSRARGPSSRHPSQPNSPRFHTFSVGNSVSNGNGNGSMKHGEYSSYDMDTENAADDERTPLIPTRSPRVRNSRRRNSATLRQLERRHRRSGGWCRRFAGCLVLSILLLVVVFCSVGLVFATTKPLDNLKARDIQNVVASQDQIMLDLIVDAVNPNIIGVVVADMDVTIFAKSKHVGSDKWWREHGKPRQHDDNTEHWPPIRTTDDTVIVSNDDDSIAKHGVDEGTDPITDPDGGEPRTMTLGRIFHFGTPLNFDGSFFKRRRVEAIGEISLQHPGNKTEAGGTARWEEVLQYPFELIVRGYLKYQLPLSTREHKVSIISTYLYDPDTEKKKLKAVTLEKNSRGDLSFQPVTPKNAGRYDRRALPRVEFP